MTHPKDDRPLLDREEQEFVDRLAAHYAPPSLSAAGRVAFDEALRTRIEGSWRRPRLVPAILAGAAAAAAALLWISFSGSVGPAAQDAGTWESQLFLSSDLSPAQDRDEGDVLPEDYLAIASIFLGE